MAIARPKIPDELNSLPNDQWINIINNYIKNNTDRQIAIMYYINGMPQIDIAEELHYSRSTIKKRIPKILNIIEKYHKVTKD